MNWLDNLMDRLTRRGTKLVASGHPPADTEPATGGSELSEELQAGYGGDTAAAQPPPDADPDALADEDVAPGDDPYAGGDDAPGERPPQAPR